MVTGFPATGRIFGRQADVAHPKPGSFGSHGHRIDFDPVIVPQSAKCLNSKMVKHCALTPATFGHFDDYGLVRQHILVVTVVVLS